MHIAHLTSAHPRFDIRVFLKECRSLVLSGHDVTLVVADGHGSELYEGVSIVDVGLLPGRLNRMLRITWRIYRQALELNADVYHLHDPELLPLGLRLKKSGKKVLFDAHEDVPKQILGKHYLKPWVRRLVSWGYALFERYACSRFDGVVAATPYIRDKFLVMNPNSVDINNYPMIGELDSSMPWTEKKLEVCYVGGIAEIRGVKELVRAMELVTTNTSLNLAGDFSEDRVRDEVATYPGWANVKATGMLGRTEVRDVLARSMAGLVTLHPTPNYLDSLPIKMFEYMSAGLPVVASNFDLWKDIVEKNDCGLCVDPLNPQAIASAIDFLVSNPAEAERMGKNGRQAVSSLYNWTAEEKKLLNFYDLIAMN